MEVSKEVSRKISLIVGFLFATNIVTSLQSAPLKGCESDPIYLGTKSALDQARSLSNNQKLAEANKVLDGSLDKLVKYETDQKLYLQHPPQKLVLDDTGLELAQAEIAARKNGLVGAVDMKSSMLERNLRVLCDELNYRARRK